MTQIIGPQVVGSVDNKNGTGSDVEAFKNFLKDPNTQIPLESNFLVIFESTPGVFNANAAPSFSELGYEYKWSVDSTKDTLLSLIQANSNTSLAGNVCLFAQSFNTPSESVDVQRPSEVAGDGPSGSLLAGVYAQGRRQYEELTLTFLETNKSFIDFVIRPWITLVGHYGLTTRAANSTQNVKINITCVLFDKNNNNSIRKIYNFTGCAPVSMGGYEYSYDQDEGVKKLKVNFVFNRFSIDDANPSSLPS